jgi:hypothetical protein
LWKYDFNRQVEVKEQISNGLIDSFKNELNIDQTTAEKLTKEILSNYIDITPPMHNEEPPRMDMIFFSKNGPIGGQGESYKPGNIRYNLSQLINASTDSGLAIASALSGIPWVVSITVAKIIYNLFQASKIKLTEIEGFIVETIHRYHTQGINMVDSKTVLTQVNILFSNISRSKVGQDEFDRGLENLIRINVIKRSPNGLCLIESIRYSCR